MKYLHQNRQDFRDFVIDIANETGIDEAIVEKDYYVTLMLNRLSEIEPNTIFKGGTSLSKCYGIINRFSEDIDLNYNNGDERPSEKMRVKFSKEIRQCADDLGLKPANFSDDRPVRAKNRFIRYIYDYDPIFKSEGTIKSDLMIETAMFAPAMPVETRPIGSIAENYLIKHGAKDIAGQLGLSGYNITAQSIERTYVDKLFAVADYYLDDRIKEHSRHMYDLYMISQNYDITKISPDFIQGVRNDRNEFMKSIVSRPEYSLSDVLQEIIDKDIYKEDYNSITRNMLYDDVTYEQTKDQLQVITDIVKDMPCFQRQDKTPDTEYHMQFKDLREDIAGIDRANAAKKALKKKDKQQERHNKHKSIDQKRKITVR